MTDLRRVHEELLATLDELEAFTAGPACDPAWLARIRHRLARASGERRRLVDRLCAELIRNARGERAERLRALRVSNLDARVAATAHVGIWTPDEVARDWPGYCRVAARMRARARAQIAAEKALLEVRPHLTFRMRYVAVPAGIALHGHSGRGARRPSGENDSVN